MQIYLFFQKKKLVYICTEFAVIELIDRLVVDMDKMNTPINIFLDVSNGYGTRNHKIEILWHKWGHI